MRKKEYVHARGSFSLLLLLFLLILWCKNKYVFSLILQCSSHMLIFSLLEHVYDTFIVEIYFFISKICLLSYLFLIKKLICIFIRCRSRFFSIKNWFASSLDADLNFSQIKNWFASSLDADLNFSQIKNWFASFLDVDLNFFWIKNRFVSSLDTNLNFSYLKKLIYVFFRCRSNFFSIANFF